MANLFWKTRTSTKNLLVTPFRTEEEFEKFVYETPEILEEIFLLKRQVRGGNKPGIPDIIGIDNDGNICIIEMKNVPVDPAIIPQVLQYALWAETNPDSIKSLWLECKNKPDDINISWDDFQVRIIVIAPQIYPSTLNVVDKINYPVDLIEINRWVESDNQWLLVKKLEQEERKSKAKPVSGLRQYDDEYYLQEYNAASAKHFLRYVKEIERHIQEKNWPLDTKRNKHYVSYKAGFFIVFGIEWIGSKTFALFFKITEKEAKSVPIQMTKYEPEWKQAVYYVDPDKTNLTDFTKLFDLAYKRISGE